MLGLKVLLTENIVYLSSAQRSGRHPAGPGSHLRKNNESFSMQADKKEKTRHNHFIKTAQPYKPKVNIGNRNQGFFWTFLKGKVYNLSLYLRILCYIRIKITSASPSLVLA